MDRYKVGGSWIDFILASSYTLNLHPLSRQKASAFLAFLLAVLPLCTRFSF